MTPGLGDDEVASRSIAAAIELLAGACHGLDPREQHEQARTVIGEHDPILVITALAQLGAAFVARYATVTGTDPAVVMHRLGMEHATRR